ncbi:SURF1 family protein [Thalassomonas sp. M1454]|uniref:SURF1 family protein n=1 Tax=Thalassomonas sp. M1454 TaxID=2594477 RepID=UPI00117F7F6E|nr:SURF1 family protein [Thalassomonas sp. M1454]TRX55141.1 SURF1 family protein [Thalassomonas sp. M1454]
MKELKSEHLLLTILKSWHWPWVIFTLLVFSILIKLGLWQASRANEKQLRLDHIQNLVSTKAIDLTTLLSLNSNSTTDPEINDLPVRISGEFNNQQKFLLDNQTNNGRLGYRVVQIFNDTQSNKSVLVNLGWVQGSINRSELPDLKDFTGIQSLQGNVRIIEQGIVLTEQKLTTEQWPVRIQQIDIAQISQLINKQLLPFVVFLDKKEDIGYEKNWQPVVMPPEKHQGYAVQWFSLAAAWLSLMIWAGFKNRVKD